MIRLGIIGMGYTGWQHLRVAEELPSLSVVTATDTDGERLADLPAGVRAAADWRALVDDPEVDAVNVCLPHDTHEEVVGAALAAGKHVLCEKPLAVDLRGAEAIGAAARRHDRVVMVEMTHRFYPPMVQARRWIEAGRVGALYAVEDRIIQPLQDGDLPAWMFSRGAAGGGVALTNGVHMLDRIRWLSGQPLRLLAGTATATHGFGDIEDTAAMQLELGDGTPVHFLAAWPRATGGHDDELTLYGARATLRVWSWRGAALEPLGGKPERCTPYPEDMDAPARVRLGMRGALAEFAAAIDAGRPASPDADELLATQRLLDEFYRLTGRQS